MPAWVKATARWGGRILLALMIVFAMAVGFGTSASDAEKMRLFGEAVERWQSNPDFRDVQVEYVELGSDGTRTRVAWISTSAGIMFLRSLPGLPPHLAVNPTSRAHYEHFNSGPLVAYLHLTNETSGMLGHTSKMMGYVSRSADPADAEIRKEWILAYKFDGYTVASDEGAVASARRLIADVEPQRPFPVFDAIAGQRSPLKSADEEAYWGELEQYWGKVVAAMEAAPDSVSRRYLPHIAHIAQELGYPMNPESMTPEQQHDVRVRLDDQIRQADVELWRVKQVNDWANGIWAQVYGTMYAKVIAPALALRFWARIVGPALLMAWIAAGWLKRRREAAETEPITEPRLAIEGPHEP